MSRCVALIQARMTSTRFPGKVLEPIAGLPAIVFMAQRARRAACLDEVAVVTSIDPSDDRLATAVRDAGVPVYRGDLENVLKRYADAARQFRAEEIVRLTGDCPLIDPDVIAAVVRLRRQAGADYASNVDPPTYPDGLDCECFTRAAIERADAQARTAAEREHVTVWMRAAAAGLRRVNHRGLVDASHLRLTVDYPDDLAAVRRLAALVASPLDCDFFDLLRVLASHPEILSLNPHARNEGLAKSLSTAAAAAGANPSIQGAKP